MSTIVKASIPTEQFAMADTFETVPDVEVEAVRLVAHASQRVLPLVWVTGADAATVQAAMEADDSTAEVRLVSQRNHDSLFRLHWVARVRFVTHVLVEENGAIVSARGTSDDWTFRILFPDHDGVSATYDACESYDVEIEQIYPLEDAPSSGSTHLTEKQFSTVRTALEEGYYDVPRGAPLEEIASEFDISHQALSERLRRGHRALIRTVIAP